MAPLINGRPRASASEEDIVAAVDLGTYAQSSWNALGGEQRADVLMRAADLLEERRLSFYSLLVRESGRTIPAAIHEVRDTVELCHRHARACRLQFSGVQRLHGPTGEINELSLHGRGVIACISPWTSALAIFADQVTAALAAGNSVVAKAAELTPPRRPRVRYLLHHDAQQQLELLLEDILTYAFGNAGQRSPALRLIILDHSIATTIIDMLSAAIQELNVGNPADWRTDVGPVITPYAAPPAATPHC